MRPELDYIARRIVVAVLVSLALLALVGAMLAQLIFGARRALNFVDRSNAEAPVVAVQRYLRDALEQVQVADVTAPGNVTSRDQPPSTAFFKSAPGAA